MGFGAITVIPLYLLYQHQHIKPLLSIDLSNTVKSNNPLVLVLGYMLVPLAAAFVSDLFYYWFHRAQHAFRLLWRLHAVHHSIEELNVWKLLAPFIGGLDQGAAARDPELVVGRHHSATGIDHDMVAPYRRQDDSRKFKDSIRTAKIPDS